MIIKIPETLQKEIDRYFELRIGTQLVPCPYYINSKISSGNLRVMSGKGEADEIELEVRIWAKLKGLDLEQADVSQIRKFMQKLHIGIDCSGFIANVFDNYLVKTGRGHLIKAIRFKDNSFSNKLRRLLRPIENIGADTLTSELNCDKITDLNSIKPGDLIRSKGKQNNAHHVALIVEVEKVDDIVKKFRYVNSNSEYADQNGVRYGEVDVNDSQGELRDQNWRDTLGQRNYFYEGLLENYEDNGIRRLKRVSF